MSGLNVTLRGRRVLCCLVLIRKRSDAKPDTLQALQQGSAGITSSVSLSATEKWASKFFA